MKKSTIVIGIDSDGEIDLAPTILNLMNAPISSYLDGKNLLANLLSV